MIDIMSWAEGNWTVNTLIKKIRPGALVSCFYIGGEEKHRSHTVLARKGKQLYQNSKSQIASKQHQI